MTALARLIAAVEEVKGPIGWGGRMRMLMDSVPSMNTKVLSEALAGSLDAAVAFQAAMLPGWLHKVEQNPGRFDVVLANPEGAVVWLTFASHVSEPIALVLAVLKALQSKEGQPA